MSPSILPRLPRILNVEVRHIPDWPGYAVSDDGRVFTCRSRGPKEQFTKWIQKILSTTRGYKHVTLHYCGAKKRYRVSRLILEVFIGPPPNDQEACHSNGDKGDNRLSNLRWDTHINNESDKKVYGRWAHGENHNKAKLIEQEIFDIRELYMHGYTQRVLAHMFAVSQVAIGKIVRREHWKHLPD